jgi:hypothetical protein
MPDLAFYWKIAADASSVDQPVAADFGSAVDLAVAAVDLAVAADFGSAIDLAAAAAVDQTVAADFGSAVELAAVDPAVAVAVVAAAAAAGSAIVLAVAVDHWVDFDLDLAFDLDQRMTDDSILGFGGSDYPIVAAEDSYSPEIAGWGCSAGLAVALAVIVVALAVIVVALADLDVRKYFQRLLLDSVADSDRLRSSVVHCYYLIRHSIPG